MICDGTMSLTSSPCSFGSSLSSFCTSRVGEQLRHVGLEQLGQMRRQHGRGVDHGVALHRRLFLQRGVDPGGGQAEGRLGGVQCRAASPAPPVGSMTMYWPGQTLPVPASTSLILMT